MRYSANCAFSVARCSFDVFITSSSWFIWAWAACRLSCKLGPWAKTRSDNDEGVSNFFCAQCRKSAGTHGSLSRPRTTARRTISWRRLYSFAKLDLAMKASTALKFTTWGALPSDRATASSHDQTSILLQFSKSASEVHWLKNLVAPPFSQPLEAQVLAAPYGPHAILYTAYRAFLLRPLRRGCAYQLPAAAPSALRYRRAT